MTDCRNTQRHATLLSLLSTTHIITIKPLLFFKLIHYTISYHFNLYFIIKKKPKLNTFQ